MNAQSLLKASLDSITIESESEACDLAIAILNMVSRTLTQPLPCKPFIQDLVVSTLSLGCEMAQSVVEVQPWNLSTSAKVHRTTMVTHYRTIHSLVLLLEDRSVFTSASPAPPLLCRYLTTRAEHHSAILSPELASIDDLILRGIVAIPADSLPSVFTARLAELLADDRWHADHTKLRVSHRVILTNSVCNSHMSYTKNAIFAYMAKSIESLPLAAVSKIHETLKQASDVGGADISRLRLLYSLQPDKDEEGDTGLGKRKRDPGWREEICDCLEVVLKANANIWNQSASLEDRLWLKAILKAIHEQFSE